MKVNYNIRNNKNSNNRNCSENDSNKENKENKVNKMNKENINKNIEDIKKRTLNQSKSACPSILNFKRLDIYTHKNEHIKLE